MCWVYVTRQVTSRRIGYSEFIPHSLIHLYNLQFHKYCHLQCRNYFSCCSHCHALDTTQLVAVGLHWTRWFHDPHSVATNHRIATTALGDFLIQTVFVWSQTNSTCCSACFLYRCLLPVACCLSQQRCRVLRHSGNRCHVTAVRGGAERWLARFRSSDSACYVTAGGGGDAMHSANTSHYIKNIIVRKCVLNFRTEYSW
jgi:hypothetical protein